MNTKNTSSFATYSMVLAYKKQKAGIISFATRHEKTLFVFAFAKT